MSKQVWWLVVHGVNMTHLWDGETFNRRKDALSYFDTVTANCAQVIRQESLHPLLPASKNKIIRIKNG